MLTKDDGEKNSNANAFAQCSVCIILVKDMSYSWQLSCLKNMSSQRDTLNFGVAEASRNRNTVQCFSIVIFFLNNLSNVGYFNGSSEEGTPPTPLPATLQALKMEAPLVKALVITTSD